MAVKGRLRFEILRRDGHLCRYCGAGAPDVRLTVAHVVPESLGGSDDPSNLVTACTSCNGGKASIAPDSAFVSEVADDAIRYAAALRAAITERERHFRHIQDRIDEFDDAWSRWGRGEGANRQPVDRSADWTATVERWLVGGLSVEELAAKIPLAMSGRRGPGAEWTYFCGVGWRMLSELQDRARELADLVDDPQDGDAIARAGWSCEECGDPELPHVCAPCAFSEGMASGVRWAGRRAESEVGA